VLNALRHQRSRKPKESALAKKLPRLRVESMKERSALEIEEEDFYKDFYDRQEN